MIGNTTPPDDPIAYAIREMGATPAEPIGGIPSGLWNVPGLPELTTGQLVGLVLSKFVEFAGGPIRELPEGLSYRYGKFWYECLSCGKDTEWEMEPEDFDITSNTNVCGGSERCLP